MSTLVGQVVEWENRGVRRRGVVVADEPPGVKHTDYDMPYPARFGSKSFRSAEGWPDGLIVEVMDEYGGVRYYAPRRRWLLPEERER